MILARHLQKPAAWLLRSGRAPERERHRVAREVPSLDLLVLLVQLDLRAAEIAGVTPSVALAVAPPHERRDREAIAVEDPAHDRGARRKLARRTERDIADGRARMALISSFGPMEISLSSEPMKTPLIVLAES
jgi:hypothetical protein